MRWAEFFFFFPQVSKHPVDPRLEVADNTLCYIQQNGHSINETSMYFTDINLQY